MKTVFSEIFRTGVGVVAALACAGTVFAVFHGWTVIGEASCSNKDAPAWVQAVGSIGAILVAVAVARWQWISSKRAEQRRELVKAFCKMDMVVALAKRGNNVFAGAPGLGITQKIAVKFAEEFDSEELMRITELLGKLGPADVTSGAALLNVLALRGALSKLGRATDKHRAEILKPDIRADWTDPLLPIKYDFVDDLERLPLLVARLTEERDRYAT
ncbi:hypothetical protein GN316_06480 [Xylophilus sp. Kf1]|nr:hypothetical protein [Xylophilus sp. Kf1]